MDNKNTPLILAGVGAAGLFLWWTMGSAKAAVAAAGGGCAKPTYDGSGKKSTRDGGDCARAGIASNPNYQWTYLVQQGDSPTRITKHFLGTDNKKPVNPSSSAQTAYVELMDENPQQGVNWAKDKFPGKDATFARNNPWTTGYNFKQLQPGDVLMLPKAWNAYIDEQGNARGELSPFPTG